MPAAGPARRRRSRLAALTLAAALFGAAAVPAAAAGPDGLTLSGAWLRLIIPARPAAGYFTLNNDSDQAQMLTGAASPACGNVMLHQSKSEGGVEKMMMVKQVAVPAHGTLEFAPNGYHLMCMTPSADLKAGQQVEMTLKFQSGATLTGQFKVCGATGC